MAGDDTNYPGVQVIERPFQPTAQVAAVATAVGAFIGKTNQGPETPYRVDSWSKFISVFGSTYTDLHNAVSDFFANGGNRCYIQRITGANAAKGSVNVYASDAPQDPQNPGQVLPGTPPLISFEALSPGSWGNLLYANIGARDVVNKRFDISLFRVPATIVFDPTKRNSEYLIEQWIDLSLDATDARYIYSMTNGPGGSGSSFVKVSGQSYDPTAPNTRPYPQTISTNKFNGGVDGSYIDPSYNNSASYQAGIDQMNTVPEPLVLNIPNVPDSDVIRYAVSSAQNKGNIFVVIDPPINKLPSEITSYADTDLGIGSLGVSTPSYGALYYPWCYLPALGSAASGKTVLRPPGGAVVGLYLSTDSTYGVWQAPAGTRARLAGAIDTERKFSNGDLALLNNHNVNVIKPSPGNGIVVFGTRTLKKSGKDIYIPVRRNLIYIRESCTNLTQFAPFRSNDTRLWQDIRGALDRFLGGLWSSGGLKGVTASQAYFIKCDATNNTPISIGNGYTYVDVGVALLTPAEFIIITLGQFDGGADVIVSGL